MTNTSRYMSILAKVMRNKNSTEIGINREKYNRLYYMIHSDLNTLLHKSLYPYTSDIIQKTGDMLEAMEPLYICPEIVGKKCLLVSNHITTSVFTVCRSLFGSQEFVSQLIKVYTQIPFIVVDSDEEETIEILNYANVRIPLLANEFKYLVIESGKRKIALNKVVQFVIVKTKLIDSQLCIISDNIYGNADIMFSRGISQRIAYLDDEGVKTINKRLLNGFSALIMSDDLLINTMDNPIVTKYRRITFSEVYEYAVREVQSVLYGFLEEYISIETQILDYYETQINQAKNTLHEVVGDIVRLGDSRDQTLQSIRSFEKVREKRLKSEDKAIDAILKNIEETVIEICMDLGENLITGKQIARSVFDNIFESLFRCKKFNSGFGKKLLSRLYSYEYDNYELVSAYVQMKSGTKARYDAIEIDKVEWEKAKMLIDILDPDKIPKNYLCMYIEALGEHCCSGKELYAKSLVAPEKQKRELLQESFDKGYEAAGLALLEKYKKGDKNVNIFSLANALVPEACMLVANQKISHYQNRRRFADLSDNEFTYYKIAAAKQYPPAIGKIVDVIFESRFSSGFQIPINEIGDSKYEEMIENGHVICQLCRFLISKIYQVNHYSEVLGIVLFCLNENLSESMSLLSNVESALAYYCKGNMFEFGGGVSIDLEEAIKNYEKSIKKGLSGRVQKRLAACQEKKTRFFYEQSTNNIYQENESYRSSSVYTGSTSVDDGCFTPETQILMANGTYNSAKNIKTGDLVIVYNHYTGNLCEEKIVANVHEIAEKKEYNVIMLNFDNRNKLEIVQSHVLFDLSNNEYVWINDKNVHLYIGHKFASYSDGLIVPLELIAYSIELRNTFYYVPISRCHLNVFAENILTMPPTKLTVHMFKIDYKMCYDLSILDNVGITPYEEISNLVSLEEYEELPCKYLAAVLSENNCTIEDFEYALTLYREQTKYFK